MSKFFQEKIFMKNKNFRKCLDFTLQSIMFFNVFIIVTFQFNGFIQIIIFLIFIIFYGFYCFNSLNSIEWNNLNEIFYKNELIQIMNTLFSKKINFTFERISFHLNNKIKEITSSKKKNFNYRSCRDISGLLNLNENNKNESQSLIELKINFELFFDSAKSKLDYFINKEKFIKKYEKFDTHFKFEENISLPGIKKTYLINSGKKMPFLVNKNIYLFFTFIIPIIEIYKIYMRCFISNKNFTIKKLLSSKKHLNNPINSQIYKEFNPRLEIGKKKFEVLHFFSLGSIDNNFDICYNININNFKNDIDNDNDLVIYNETLDIYEEKLKAYKNQDINIFNFTHKNLKGLNDTNENDSLFEENNISHENNNYNNNINNNDGNNDNKNYLINEFGLKREDNSNYYLMDSDIKSKIFKNEL
jgi:hypothetical protein